MILRTSLLLQLLLQAERLSQQANGNMSSSCVNPSPEQRTQTPTGFLLLTVLGVPSPSGLIKLQSPCALSSERGKYFYLQASGLLSLHMVASSSSLRSLFRKRLLEESIPGHLFCLHSSPIILVSIPVYFQLSISHGLNVTKYLGGWGWEVLFLAICFLSLSLEQKPHEVKKLCCSYNKLHCQCLAQCLSLCGHSVFPE